MIGSVNGVESSGMSMDEVRRRGRYVSPTGLCDKSRLTTLLKGSTDKTPGGTHPDIILSSDEVTYCQIKSSVVVPGPNKKIVN